MQMILILTVLAALVLYVSYYDFRWMIIPDGATAGVLFVGAGYQFLATGLTGATEGLAFAIAVFGGFWLVRLTYMKYRGIAGLGFGDVKFAGAAAIWLSPLAFPVYLFVATSSALIFLVVGTIFRGGSLSRRIPFGPFLAFALFVSVVADRFGNISQVFTHEIAFQF